MSCLEASIDTFQLNMKGYDSTGKDTLVTGDKIDKSKIFSKYKSTIPNVLLKLSNGEKNYLTNKAINYKYYTDGNYYFVENDNLDIYCFGETFEEAIQEFQYDIIDMYNHYKKVSKNDLLQFALELKEKYKDLLTEL